MKSNTSFGGMNQKRDDSLGSIQCPRCKKQVRVDASRMHSCYVNWLEEAWNKCIAIEAGYKNHCLINPWK